MTLTNKYVLSGHNFNLNFLMLAIQVCRTPSLKCVELSAKQDLPEFDMCFGHPDPEDYENY